MLPLHETYKAYLPRLTADNYRVTSPTSGEYNCIAWAASITDEWWWPVPRRDWPDGVPCELTLSAFAAAFATIGFGPGSDDSLEPGVEKIALYAKDAIPTHAARLLLSGWWTSKLGKDVDVEHATLDAIAGGLYGEPVLILSRPLARPANPPPDPEHSGPSATTSP